MGRLQEYLNYLEKYTEIHGNQTVILYQCGMFYEVYGIENSTEKIGNASEVARLLNIQLTRLDKKVLEVSLSNPLMAGFPLSSLDQNVDKLLAVGCTVVIVEQVGERIVRGKTEQIREVTNIFSAGTYTKTTRADNYLVCVYIEGSKNRYGSQMYDVGLSAIDVSTGRSYTHHTFSSNLDTHISLDEIQRFVYSFSPIEMIIYTDKESTDVPLNFKSLCDIVRCNVVRKQVMQNAYHNHLLGQYFPFHGELDPVLYLDFERHAAAATSYCLLIEYCANHNPILLKQLDRPATWNEHNTVILDNNAVTQLNLITTDSGASKSKFHSIFSLISQVSTGMGKRMLKQRLLSPIIDPKQIRQRYAHVETMLSIIQHDPNSIGTTTSLIRRSDLTDNELIEWYKVIQGYLQEILDIEKLHRRLKIGRLQPSELASLLDSYDTIKELCKLVYGGDSFKDLISIPKYQSVPKQLDILINMFDVIDRKVAVRFNMGKITENIFKEGHCEVLDKLTVAIDESRSKMQDIADVMNHAILATYKSKPKDCHPVKIQHNDNQQYYLGMAGSIYTRLKRTELGKLVKQYDIEEKKTSVRLRSGKLSEPIQIIESSLRKLQSRVGKIYTELLDNVSKWEMDQGVFKILCDLVGELDVYKSTAKTSQKYRYTQPIINVNADDDDASKFVVEGIRHPLIEQIQSKQEYVAHSFELGSQHDGMLLYGVNAAGKSSTMKAVGIVTIMAQAGFYVSCKRLELVPFKSIMTRIVGNDDLFSGQSSFAVEMSELRSILKRSNAYSLVLGDEICHGTETKSAISLVAASLVQLAKQRVKFIFATHLHQLSDIDEVKELNRIRQCHLTVHYDSVRDQLIYDRKLQDGPGTSQYGIEVARAMKLPQNVIDQAMQLRMKYYGEGDIRAISSVYNKQVYVDVCGICDEKACETHHIKFQSEADQNGHINHVHKDHASNLVPLCEKHHQMVHAPQKGGQELVIFGYRSDGTLDYKLRKHYKSFKVKSIKIRKKNEAI